MSLEQVKEFHEAFGHPVSESPRLIEFDRYTLRTSLIQEEMLETLQAFLEGDLIKVADGLSDLSVVINGALLEFGGTEGTKDYNYDITEGTVPGIRTDEFFMVVVMGEMYMQVIQLDALYANGDVESIIEILKDMARTTANTATVLGIPLQEINEVVHKANMSKLGEDGKPIYRESDNKILKGPNFRPPEEDIERILREHGADL